MDKKLVILKNIYTQFTKETKIQEAIALAGPYVAPPCLKEKLAHNSYDDSANWSSPLRVCYLLKILTVHIFFKWILEFYLQA